MDTTDNRLPTQLNLLGEIFKKEMGEDLIFAEICYWAKSEEEIRNSGNETSHTYPGLSKFT